MVDFIIAKQNPAAHFRRPDDVVTDPVLTPRQKLELLRRWEYDARELEVATEENMPSGEQAPVRLDDVLRALDRLGEQPAAATGASKHG